jgi:5-methylcytosine-specific restriction protein B
VHNQAWLSFDLLYSSYYQENLKNPQFDALIDTIQALNVDIRDDDMLGEGLDNV